MGIESLVLEAGGGAMVGVGFFANYHVWIIGKKYNDTLREMEKFGVKDDARLASRIVNYQSPVYRLFGIQGDLNKFDSSLYSMLLELFKVTGKTILQFSDRLLGLITQGNEYTSIRVYPPQIHDDGSAKIKVKFNFEWGTITENIAASKEAAFSLPKVVYFFQLKRLPIGIY